MTPLVVANAKTLWFVTRGSGVVALLLLTCSMLLGVVVGVRARSTRWPRFALTNVHRNLTLLAVVFVGVHVVTTITDGYATISPVAVFVPFASSYRPVWLGLGAISLDLLLALIVTSLARRHIGPRLWRSVHWLAYATWPIALLHAFGTGSDARLGWLAALGVGCLLTIAVAVLARVVLAPGWTVARVGGGLAALATPIAVFVWYQSGPAQQGWARRAGTPAAILAKGTPRARGITNISLRRAAAPTSFETALAGSAHEVQASDGLVTVRLDLRLRGGPRGAARIDLRGIPQDVGVAMTASGVSFVPATTRAIYTGQVIGLEGQRIVATVRDAAGDHLRLDLVLRIDGTSHRVTGVLKAGVNR